ncbi:MAG: glycine cleavage system protein GcvH [Clostridiaceae bacterium]|jgi:glycine cleavage system H protein|nr:glycine cleavage system protein GcvH [Clostridiaceae bacterium]
MEIYEGMKFTKEHEWAREEGGKVYIGISDYAQNALGDIVYVELPETGKKVKAGDPISVVESVKTASDIYSPVSGTVSGVNEALADSPELLNEDPYENYIAVIDPDDLSELEDLMDEEEYREFCSREE